MNGIFLQGGGAKGAFQAGALHRLYEDGLRFNMASGTSIGAINMYFLLTGNIGKMKEIWNDVDLRRFDHEYGCVSKVIDNEPIIRILREMGIMGQELEKAFLNYVHVVDGKLVEMKRDIANLDSESRLELVKCSSLLPFGAESRAGKNEIVEGFDSERVFNQFRKDVENGEYNGFRLDGGIRNNLFVEPFVENPVERLYMILLKRNIKIPKEIRDIYGDRAVVIEPPEDFLPSDTLRFEKEFCRKCFRDGEKAAAERVLR